MNPAPADVMGRQTGGTAGGSAPGQPPLAFWAHQGVEYLLAVLLVLTTIHLRSSLVAPILAVALVLMALPLVSDGPLGACKLISRRTHHLIDRALVAVLVAVPLLARSHDLVLVVVSEGLALGLAMLIRRTEYRPQPRRAATTRPASLAAPQASRAVRVAGFAVGRVRRDGPRRLGQLIGTRRQKRDGRSSSEGPL